MKKTLSKTLITTMVMAFVLTAGATQSFAGDKQISKPVININTASESQLALLPGVGQSTAARIIKYREKRKFKKIEDIIRVKGIGRKTFRKMKPYLTVAGATTATTKIKRTT